MAPVSVFDVAAYIVQRLGSMTTVKLQKLVYYCQVWSLVFDDEPLFLEEIQAWANGPVCYPLYRLHSGEFTVDRVEVGSPEVLSASQKATIEEVLRAYGNFKSQELSNLTHDEAPWKEARQGLAPMERGCSVISHASMKEYFEALHASWQEDRQAAV